MNLSEIHSKPFSETVLKAGYGIADAETDFSETYEIGDRGCLKVEGKAGADKTFFSILYAASENEIVNLKAFPTSQHQTEHFIHVDVVDICITYCLGSSVLYQTDKSAAVFKVSDNFEQELNERRKAEGKPIVERAMITSGAVVGFSGTTTLNAIKNLGALTAKCLGKAEVKDILYLYREGHLHEHAFFERMYIIVELLRGRAVFNALKEMERDYLTNYPQLYRHHSSNKQHVRALRALSTDFSSELGNPKKGKETYKRYLKILLYNYLRF